MKNENLKAATVYLSAEEYSALKEEADDYEVTVSAAIRSKMGLPRIERGAPVRNIKAVIKKKKKRKG